MKKTVFVLLLVYSVFSPRVLYAFEPFIIKGIKVSGLQRISQAAVIRDIPIRVGDQLTQGDTRRIIEGLFKTGFFKQVELTKQGEVLLVSVIERPSIAEVSVTGITQKKPIKKILKELNLQKGRLFDKAKLTQAERSIKRFYLMNGRYGVKIHTEIRKEPRNRVGLTIEIYEGDVARIKEVKIIGNRAFSQKTLLKGLRTSKTGWLSWLTKDDRYAQEKLAADLETLRSYYLDRGYLRFQNDSTQVSLSLDKKDLYIVIHVSEGEQYYFSSTQVLGEYHGVSQESLEKAIAPINKGDLFSRKLLIESKENLEKVLGNAGYYFAKIKPAPEIDEAKKTVKLIYYVEPGHKIYVRHIHIHGNYTTQDEVIRRELRQLEGSVISTAKVEAGKKNIERRGFTQEAEVEAIPVPGIQDQVDLEYKFEEQRLGQFSAGINYSPSSGFGVEAALSQRNFFGTGKAGGLSFNKTKVTTAYEATYFNPYHTVDGIGFGANAFYHETNLSKISTTTEYFTNSYGSGLNWSFPLSDYEKLNLGGMYKDTRVKSIGFATAQEVQAFTGEKGTHYREWIGMVSWVYDSLDRLIFSTEGLFQEVGSLFTVPGGKIEYYQLKYDARYYYAITRTKKYIIKLSSYLTFGDGYGKTKKFPFYRHFYAGGVDTVRGYEERSLGPKDSTGRAFGGNMLVSGRLEFIFPNPIKPDAKSIRTALFLDIGQVYDTSRHDRGSSKVPKLSSGIALAWNSPLGAPLMFILGWPLNYKDGDGEKKLFAFTFSGTF